MKLIYTFIIQVKKKKNTDMYVFIVKWKLRETLENLMTFFNL